MNTKLWDVDYLIRKEFMYVPKHEIRKVTDVMVSTGGADPEGITEKLMKGVCPEFQDTKFHFIVGALNPRIDAINAFATSNIVLHINEKNMSGLMTSCGIAISAAGSALYELCACGTPTITYTFAGNQLRAAKEFEYQGLMINVGDYRNNEGFVQSITAKLKELIDHPEKRQQLSPRMQQIIDGRGAERLTSEIWNHIIHEALEAVKDENALH